MYDTEHKKHDGKPNKPDDQKRRCCHVLEGEKQHMLQSSTVRLLQNDRQLASKVFDDDIPELHNLRQ
jgi:hypothetical protein